MTPDDYRLNNGDDATLSAGQGSFLVGPGEELTSGEILARLHAALRTFARAIAEGKRPSNPHDGRFDDVPF